jgi:hypothetical protein
LEKRKVEVDALPLDMDRETATASTSGCCGGCGGG